MRQRMKLMDMIAALVASLDERPIASHKFRSQNARFGV
jgi:hypothetical protein